NPDGSLDTSFGSGGVVTTPIGTGTDSGRSITLQADGKILVGGLSNNGSNDDFALIRYNVDGSLDTSFGTGGKVTTAVGTSTDQGRSVTVQPDGKILVGGYSLVGGVEDFSLVRYNANGSLDTSFGTGGKLTTAIGSGLDFGTSVIVQPDGKIVIGGYSITGNYDFAMIRYDANGSLDTGFGTGGKVTTTIGSGNDYSFGLKVQSDGKLVLAGLAGIGSTEDVALIRYNIDGSLDTSFGTGGKVTTAIGTGNDRAWNLAFQPDGKIVIGGYARIGSTDDMALVRYHANGSLDTSFGSGGKVTTAIGAGSEQAYDLFVQADGKIVVSGFARVGATDDFAVVRYNVDGSLDTRFDLASTLGGSVSTTENGSPVVLDGNVQIFDVELSSSNFSGATLTLARNGGANSQDLFSATGTLDALTQGSNLVVGGTTIGSITTNSGGTLVLSFNASATNALVNSAMQQIAYANSSEAPPANVQIDWSFSDGNSGAQGTGGALTATGNVVVNITAVNDAPVALNDSFSTGENVPVTFDVRDNDGDVDSSTLNVTQINSTAISIGGSVAVTGGSVMLNADGTLTFTPTANWRGSPSFTYTLSDGSLTAIATVNGTVNGVNGAPVAVADAATALEAGGVGNGTAGTNPAGNVLTNDTDPDSVDTKTVIGVASGIVGSTSGNVGNSISGAYGMISIAADGSYIYTVDNSNAAVQALRTPANSLTDTFTYTMRDAAGLTSTTQVTITIQGANDAPHNINGTLTIAENSSNGAAVGTVAGQDVDSGDSLTYSLVDSAGGRFAVNSSTGQVTVAGGSLLDFESASSHNLTVRVSDASGATFDRVLNVQVTNVNEAPVLTDTPLNLTVAEDAGNPSGATGLLLSTFTGGIADVDAGALKGIAITAISETSGKWYYTINGGSTWSAIGTVSSTSSLLLADNANTRLYFAPNLNYNGNAVSALTFRAWDQTSGSVGTKVNTTSNGLSTAFSTATDAIAVTVTSVNDAPLLTAGGTLASIMEGTLNPSGALISTLATANDSADSGSIAGYAIVGSTANSLTQGVWQYSTDGGVNWSDVGSVSNGSNALSVSATTRMRFVPAAGFYGIPNGLTIRALDNSYSSGFSTSGPAEVRVNVDTTLNGGASSISAATASIGTNITPDASKTSHMVLHWKLDDTGSGAYLGQDASQRATMSIADASGHGLGGVAINMDGTEWIDGRTGGAINLNGVDPAAYDYIVSSSTLNLTPTQYTVAFWVNADAMGQWRPILGEDAGGVTGPDWMNFLFHGAPGGQVYMGQTGSNRFALAAGTLTTGTWTHFAMTFDNGVARAYKNGALLGTASGWAIGSTWGTFFLGGPQSWEGTDARFDDLRIYKIALSASDVVTIANPPLLGSMEGTAVSYTENGAAVALTNALTLTDANNGTMASATVAIVRNLTAGDTLSFTNQNGISGSFDSSTGVLTLSGTASAANYQAALRSVQFSSTSEDPTAGGTANTRSIAFLVNDGTLDSNPIRRDIALTALNDAPVLDSTASPMLGTFLEGATNPSGITVSSLVVDGSITDPDGSVVEAIAITGLNTSLGTWQYSLNGGTNWLTINAELINSQTNELALLLGPTAQLRLIPFGDLNGSVSDAITFRAWDQTSGSEGQYAVITATGATSA
ncbi:MAG: beta strand repeat-containing protein, partial [Planctomycetota bacterium]